MNRTFKKCGLQVIAAVFVLTLGLFGVSSVQAQTVSPTIVGANPQLNWLTEQEALAVLVAEMAGLKGQLQNLTPGTPAYINVDNHLAYFLNLYYTIEGGTPVAQAVGNSLALTTLNSAAPPKTISQPVLNGLYNEAVDLLTK